MHFWHTCLKLIFRMCNIVYFHITFLHNCKCENVVSRSRLTHIHESCNSGVNDLLLLQLEGKLITLGLHLPMASTCAQTHVTAGLMSSERRLHVMLTQVKDSLPQLTKLRTRAFLNAQMEFSPFHKTTCPLFIPASVEPIFSLFCLAFFLFRL